MVLIKKKKTKTPIFKKKVIQAHMCCAPGLFKVLLSSSQHASEQILLFSSFTDEDTEA